MHLIILNLFAQIEGSINKQGNDRNLLLRVINKAEILQKFEKGFSMIQVAKEKNY